MTLPTKIFRQWSGEIEAYEHRDLQANVMGLGPCGSKVVLGGRRYLALLDMSNPSEVLVKIPRRSKWDVTCVSCHKKFCAVASNDSVDFYSEDMILVSKIQKGHQRCITDVEWKPDEFSRSLVTTSLDTYIHLWDTRELKRPQLTFNGMIGSAQCKWNRHNSNVFATTHEGDVKLWDIRNDNAPFQYFTSHISAKILSFDWSYNDEFEFVTSGYQDKYIKFHHLNKPEQKNSILRMAVPVWKARYTPFGEGLATVIIPHVNQNDNSLFLWNINHPDSPVHSFFGHRDVIFDFHWRKSQENEENVEILTWSRDNTLRLWHVDRAVQFQCGLENEDVSCSSPKNGTPECLRNLEMNDRLAEDGDKENEDDTLQKEFRMTNVKFKNLSITEKNLQKRLVKVSMKSGIILVVHFPSKYPNGSIVPTFIFIKSSNTYDLPSSIRQKIILSLKTLAHNQIKLGKPCLEPCLYHLDSIISEEFIFSDDGVLIREDTEDVSFPMADNRSRRRDSIFVHFDADGNVPYPRTSGSTFCGNGSLVIFGSKRLSHSGITPRALSAYGAQLIDGLRMDDFEKTVAVKSSSTSDTDGVPPPVSNTNSLTRKGRFCVRAVKSLTPADDGISNKSDGGNNVSVTASSEELNPNHIKRRRILLNQAKVTILNVSELFPFTRYLASNYLFTSSTLSASEMCNINAKVAQKANRKDLAQIWILASQAAKLADSQSSEPDLWTHHPLGRPLLTSLIYHYIQTRDPQTAATLILIFQNSETFQQSEEDKEITESSKQSSSPSKKPIKFFLESSSNKVSKPKKSIAFKTTDIKQCKNHNNKFWFLRPGALNPVHSSSSISPYHTVSAVTEASSFMMSVGSSSRIREEGEDPLYLDPPSRLGQYFSNKCRSNSWSSAPHVFTSDNEPFSVLPLSKLTTSTSAPHFESSSSLSKIGSKSSLASLLDPKYKKLYDSVKKVYGDMLYRWKLLNKRTELLKKTPTSDEIFLPDAFHAIVQDEDRNKIMICSLCKLSVRGMASSCLSCGHGGHTSHLIEWFTSPNIPCPTGCGCFCQSETYENV